MSLILIIFFALASLLFTVIGFFAIKSIKSSSKIERFFFTEDPFLFIERSFKNDLKENWIALFNFLQKAMKIKKSSGSIFKAELQFSHKNAITKTFISIDVDVEKRMFFFTYLDKKFILNFEGHIISTNIRPGKINRILEIWLYLIHNSNKHR